MLLSSAVCYRVGFAVALIGYRRRIHAAFVGRAVVCYRVGFAVALIGYRRRIHAAFVGRAVVCCRVGFALALIMLLSSAVPSSDVAMASPSLSSCCFRRPCRRLLSRWLRPRSRHATFVGRAVVCCRDGLAMALPSLSSRCFRRPCRRLLSRWLRPRSHHATFIGSAVVCCRDGSAVAPIMLLSPAMPSSAVVMRLLSSAEAKRGNTRTCMHADACTSMHARLHALA